MKVRTVYGLSQNRLGAIMNPELWGRDGQQKLEVHLHTSDCECVIIAASSNLSRLKALSASSLITGRARCQAPCP